MYSGIPGSGPCQPARLHKRDHPSRDRMVATRTGRPLQTRLRLGAGRYHRTHCLGWHATTAKPGSAGEVQLSLVRLARHLVRHPRSHHEHRAVTGAEPRPRLLCDNLVVCTSPGGVSAPGASQGCRCAVRPHEVDRRRLACRELGSTRSRLCRPTSKAERDARCGHLRSQGRGSQVKPTSGAGTTLDLGPQRDRGSSENRITKPI